MICYYLWIIIFYNHIIFISFNNSWARISSVDINSKVPPNFHRLWRLNSQSKRIPWIRELRRKHMILMKIEIKKKLVQRRLKWVLVFISIVWCRNLRKKVTLLSISIRKRTVKSVIIVYRIWQRLYRKLNNLNLPKHHRNF